MINGIWKNTICPKFYTLSIHVPASEDLQSEVMSLIKPTDTAGKKDKCSGAVNIFFKS